MAEAEIGIIGGTGLYQAGEIEGVRQIRRVVFRARGRRARDRHRPWRRHLRLHPTNRRVRIGVRAAVRFRSRTTVLRRTVRCRIRQ